MGPTKPDRPESTLAGMATGGFIVGILASIWTWGFTPLVIGVVWFFLCALLAAAKNN
jgi:hypothetical protein